MSTAIPTFEPKSIRAGDTVKWMKSLLDYPAADWDLKYKIVGNATSPVSVTAAENGDQFEITISATATADLAEGSYRLIGWVEDGTERFTIYDDILIVEANTPAATSATDTRTHAQRTLDLINAAIESYSTRPVEEIEIAGRRISRPSLKDLYTLKTKYEKVVRREKNGGVSERIVASFPKVR
jgi:hypothetical protein